MSRSGSCAIIFSRVLQLLETFAEHLVIDIRGDKQYLVIIELGRLIHQITISGKRDLDFRVGLYVTLHMGSFAEWTKSQPVQFDSYSLRAIS